VFFQENSDLVISKRGSGSQCSDFLQRIANPIPCSLFRVFISSTFKAKDHIRVSSLRLEISTKFFYMLGWLIQHLRTDEDAAD